jgi:hypothetical protein
MEPGRWAIAYLRLSSAAEATIALSDEEPVN